MDVEEAIKKRRAVRTYTDKPIPDEVLDRVLRLALRAPTGGGAQAWALMLVKDPAKRLEIAELIIRGASEYFQVLRPKKEGTSDEEHAAWAKEYAETVLGTYRVAPAWILALYVPRYPYPPEMAEGGYLDDVISVSFAVENMMLVAREEGLGTVPTTAFQRYEKDRLREIVGIPPEADPLIVTPIGYPESFPEGMAPALKRNFQGWKALVHDDEYGNTRA
jgi:nitroreductase